MDITLTRREMVKRQTMFDKSSCSTSGTCHVMHVNNPVIICEQEKNAKKFLKEHVIVCRWYNRIFVLLKQVNNVPVINKTNLYLSQNVYIMTFRSHNDI